MNHLQLIRESEEKKARELREWQAQQRKDDQDRQAKQRKEDLTHRNKEWWQKWALFALGVISTAVVALLTKR